MSLQAVMETENHGSGNAELLECEALQRCLDDEQAQILRVEQRLSKFMTDVAFAEFPALKNMSAAQIREFGVHVALCSGEFAIEAANLAFRAEQEK